MGRRSGLSGDRILVISLEYLPPHLSGNGVYAEHVVRALKKRWNVDVATAYFGGALPEEVVTVPLNRNTHGRDLDLEFTLKSLRLLDEMDNISLIIGVDWPSAPLSLALKKKAHCPLIWMPFRIFSNYTDSLVINELEKMIAREADEILSLSKADAMLIEKFFMRKASILYPPITCRRTVLPREKENFALTVSRISPEKNIERLIEALPRINEALKLVIAGAALEVEYQEKLKNIAESLGVKERVVFTGSLSREELSELYSRAMLFVSPTAYEPFGLSIVEAAYHGLPIVMDGSGLVGAGELFEHERDCLKVNMRSAENVAEAVNVLFENRNMADRLGEEAKKVAEKLGAEAFEEKINNFILEVTNR